MKSGTRRRLIWSAQLALGIVLCWWLIASDQLDMNSYSGLLDRFGLQMILAVFLFQLLSFVLFVARWWILVRVQRIDVPFAAVMRSGFQGLFTNLFLPGGIGVDGLRALYLQKHHRAQLVPGLASLVVDRIVGFAGLAVLGLLSCLVFLLVRDEDVLTAFLWVNVALLLMIFCALAVLSGAVRPRIVKVAIDRFELLRRFTSSFELYRHHRAALITSLVVSVGVHASTCAAWAIAFVALGSQVQVSAVFVIAAMIAVVRMLPISPMGLGVTDGLAEALFLQISVDTGAEVQMLVRSLAVIIFLVAGAALIPTRDRAQRAQQA